MSADTIAGYVVFVAVGVPALVFVVIVVRGERSGLPRAHGRVPHSPRSMRGWQASVVRSIRRRGR